MRPDDDCNFCLALLDAHCAVNGEPFCKLKEKYLTTDISADAILDEFYALATDEQLVKTDPEVQRRMQYLKQADPGRLAAEKWLRNYRFGKDS